MSGYRPKFGRVFTAWLIGILLLISTLVAVAVMLWFKLPIWNPALVIKYSPFVDPVFRADGGPGLTDKEYDPYGNMFVDRIEGWGATISPFVKASLLSDDERIRRAAMVACNVLVPRGVLQLDEALSSSLIHLLADTAPGVRMSAAYCLGVLRDPNSIKPMIDQLTVESRLNVAIRFCETLGVLGDQRALVALDRIVTARLQTDMQQFLVIRALEAYVKINRQAGIERLITAISLRDGVIRLSAIMILGRMQAVQATDFLLGLLSDSDPRVHVEALLALAAMDKKDVSGQLMPHLDDNPINLESDLDEDNRLNVLMSEDVLKVIDGLPFNPEQHEKWKSIRARSQAFLDQK